MSGDFKEFSHDLRNYPWIGGTKLIILLVSLSLKLSFYE